MKKLLVSLLLLLAAYAYGGAQPSLAIKEVDIASNVGQEFSALDMVLIAYYTCPRAKITLELANHTPENMRFYGELPHDKIYAKFEALSEKYNEECDIIYTGIATPHGDVIEPGHTYRIQVILGLGTLTAENYEDFLKDFFNSLIITYQKYDWGEELMYEVVSQKPEWENLTVRTYNENSLEDLYQ